MTHSAAVISEIARERERQISVEGWTIEHDNVHDCGELAVAAACYALGVPEVSRSCYAENGSAIISVKLWPWSTAWWNPKTSRQDLIRAAALIVAEIERLDRAAAPKTDGTS